MSRGEIAVRANAVDKWFGVGEARTQAVRGACLEAHKGEMLFLVGPSGSGKTTFLSILSGILKPDAGEVLVEGVDIWKLSPDQLADFRLHKIGFVFQDYHLFPRLTSAENVAIPLILKKVPWNQALEQAREYLEIVGLTSRADLQPIKLSGGEQQRVAIARAIASQPDILILDEPTASLDGETGRRIVEFVRTKFLNQDRSMIIVTHDNRIFEYADAILHMEDGAVQHLEQVKP